MADDKDLDAYKSFSSGDSDVDDFDTGSDGVERPAAAEGDADLDSDDDAVEMDEAFAISLKFVAETLRRAQSSGERVLYVKCSDLLQRRCLWKTFPRILGSTWKMPSRRKSCAAFATRRHLPFSTLCSSHYGL